jgi:hypothetical protein
MMFRNFFGLIFLLTTSLVQAQNFDWVINSQTIAGDRALDVAYDNLGNVYASGAYHGTFKLQSYTFTGDKSGFEDAWVAKFDSKGNVLWALPFQGPGFQSVIAIAADRVNGDLYVCGHYTDSISIGPFQLTNHDFTDCFVARISPQGIVKWAYTIESELGSATPLDIAVDKGGNNVFIAVSADDSLNVTINHVGGQESKSPGGSCVVKYTKDGLYKWSKFVYTSNHATVNSIGVDSKGNVYAAGGFEGAITWESYPSTVVSSSFSDVYLVKFSPTGVIKWVDKVGGCTIENMGCLDLDAADNVYLVGFFDHSITIGPYVLNPLKYKLNLFFTKVNGAHVYKSAKQLYTNATLRLTDIAVDDPGNAYILGKFADTLFYGTSKLITATMGNGQEVYVVKFNSLGVSSWGQTISSTNELQLYGQGIDAIKDDLVAIDGSFRNTATFNTPLQATSNGNDMYVAQIKICPPLSFTLIADTTSFCAGDTVVLRLPYNPAYTYSWVQLDSAINSTNHSSMLPVVSSGSYYAVVTNSAGCQYHSDTLLMTAVACSPKLSSVTDAGINVYPNPATDRVTVEISLDIAITTFQLFNTDGKMVLSKEISPAYSSFSFDVKKLPAGIYLLRLISSSSTASEFKIAINGEHH